MGVPFLVRFDRYAQMTYGLEAYGLGPVPNVFGANGVALVTGFLFGENWNYCSSPVSTSWTLCMASVSTSWTPGFSQPVTAWTLVPGG